MGLRLIEVFLPKTKEEQVKALLDDYAALEIWYQPLAEQQLLVRIFLDSAQTESVSDRLMTQFEAAPGFRLLSLPVEASLPRPQAPEPTTLEAEVFPDVDADQPAPMTSRVDREEIYARVADSAELSWVQLALVLLSATIAAIGLLRGSEAVIIGAMVIAPLLKPNMALAAATTLGDTTLAMRTLRTGAIGILAALAFSMLVGFAVNVSPDLPQIASRTHLSWSDGILALASGVAGALSLTAEERSAIVGVMVSVALLPPLVVLGMLLGAGLWQAALGAGLLVMTNLVCLNLAAIATLLLQDLRPRNWWESMQAEKVTGAAFGVWSLLLLILVGVVLTLRMQTSF